MRLNGNGFFMSCEEKKDKENRKYNLVRVCDDNGKIFFSRSASSVDIERFAPVDFEVDIVQGNFTDYTLINIAVAER